MNGDVGSMLASFIADVRSIAYYGIVVTSGLIGTYYALTGAYSWYETASGQGEATFREYGTDLFVASILLSVTTFLAAGGGEAFSSTSSTAYAQLSTSITDATTPTAAQNTLNALFSLCTVMGWFGQLRAAYMIREIGRGRSEASMLRLIGLLIAGSVLADLSNGVVALGNTLHVNLFS